MIRTMARAAIWGFTRLLRGGPSDLVAHGDLDHYHWNPAERRWSRHGELEEGQAEAA